MTDRELLEMAAKAAGMADATYCELTGALLDAAVAKAEGLTPHVYQNYDGWHCSVNEWNPDLGYYDPSTNWKHGGPIIDREKIATSPSGSEWCASILLCDVGDVYGPTPLIAAMRLYVASHFGEEIDL